jgi:hypothetical protein
MRQAAQNGISFGSSLPEACGCATRQEISTFHSRVPVLFELTASRNGSFWYISLLGRAVCGTIRIERGEQTALDRARNVKMYPS